MYFKVSFELSSQISVFNSFYIKNLDLKKKKKIKAQLSRENLHDQPSLLSIGHIHLERNKTHSSKLLPATRKKHLLYVKISELIYMIKGCKACHVNLH